MDGHVIGLRAGCQEKNAFVTRKHRDRSKVARSEWLIDETAMLRRYWTLQWRQSIGSLVFTILPPLDTSGSFV